MSDEFATRLSNVELDLNVIKTDIKWIKGMCAICVVIIGGVFGIDMSGAV